MGGNGESGHSTETGVGREEEGSEEGRALTSVTF